jgi:hypothetical protein
MLHRRAGLYRGCDTILVTNLGPNHEANSFFIAKRNFESLFDQSQGTIANVFETYEPVVINNCEPNRVDEYEPVRHSVKLNPSATAIASIILELTVDATIESFSVPFYGQGEQLALHREGKVGTYPEVCLTPCIVPVFFQRKEHLTDLR